MELGHYQTVKPRDYDWIARGALDTILKALGPEPDLEVGVRRLNDRKGSPTRRRGPE